MQENFRGIGETFVEKRLHEGRIFAVAQIDEHHPDVAPGIAGFVQQGLDVFPHAAGLRGYIALVEDVAFVVDGGRP